MKIISVIFVTCLIICSFSMQTFVNGRSIVSQGKRGERLLLAARNPSFGGFAGFGINNGNNRGHNSGHNSGRNSGRNSDSNDGPGDSNSNRGNDYDSPNGGSRGSNKPNGKPRTTDFDFDIEFPCSTEIDGKYPRGHHGRGLGSRSNKGKYRPCGDKMSTTATTL